METPLPAPISSPTSLLRDAMQESLQGQQLLLSEVLHQIKTSFHVNDPNLLFWIHAFARNLHTFTYTTRPFVESLLSLPWLSLEDQTARLFLHFLETLVSAEPQFGSCVINFLVSHFKSPEPNIVSISSPLLYFDRIHSTLKSILTTIPLGPTFAVAILEKHFPHRRLSLSDHQVYLQNILRILDYVPLLREAVFSLILEKLVLIDIDIQADLEDIDPSERNLQFFMELNGDDAEVPQSAMNIQGTQGDAAPSSTLAILVESDTEMDDVTASQPSALSAEALSIKLDHALDNVFTFVSQQEHKDPSLQRETFLLCLKLFKKIMLPMFKSRYCQFLLFKLCSFDPSFTDMFLGTLTKVLLDVSEPPLIRINAALYMASFLARAKYTSFQEHIKPCFQLLLLFIHSFVANNEQYAKHPNVEKFGVFYAATQGVLYLFCFHWKALCHEDTGLGEKGGLEGFERILLSKFNPLFVLKPTLVEEFARITHALNLLHCHAIIQRNHRLFLPSVQTSHHSPTMLDTFFPFEPMLLPLSQKWIDPLYTEYDRPSFFALPSSLDSLPSSDAIDLPMVHSVDDLTSCAVMDYLSPSPSNPMSAPVLLAQLGITSQ